MSNCNPQTDQILVFLVSFYVNVSFFSPFIPYWELLKHTNAVSAIQNSPTTLPLPFWDFKASIWSWFPWLIPFLARIAIFFFILLLRPCLLKCLISFIPQSVQALEDSFHKWPPAIALTFWAVQSHPLPLDDPHLDPQAGIALQPRLT